MLRLLRLVTKIISSMPAATASSTMYCNVGLSTSGNISFGITLLAGSTRVPRPATGKTALRILIISSKTFLLLVYTLVAIVGDTRTEVNQHLSHGSNERDSSSSKEKSNTLVMLSAAKHLSRWAEMLRCAQHDKRRDAYYRQL